MNAIKQISAQAKKLTKANPKLAWKDAIAKASAMYRSGKKKVGAAKKSAPRKSAPRKSAARSGAHTDTKSHNVNIRVMSGAVGSGDRIAKDKQELIRELERQIALAEYARDEVNWHRQFMKSKKYREMDPAGRESVKYTIAFYRKLERQKLDQVNAIKKLL